MHADRTTRHHDERPLRPRRHTGEPGPILERRRRLDPHRVRPSTPSDDRGRGRHDDALVRLAAGWEYPRRSQSRHIRRNDVGCSKRRRVVRPAESASSAAWRSRPASGASRSARGGAHGGSAGDPRVLLVLGRRSDSHHGGIIHDRCIDHPDHAHRSHRWTRPETLPAPRVRRRPPPHQLHQLQLRRPTPPSPPQRRPPPRVPRRRPRQPRHRLR